MRIAIFLLTVALAGAVAVPAWADMHLHADPGSDEVVVEETPGELPLGKRTRAWIDRQRSGLEASPHSTGLTPPEDYRARRRHLDSFSHPIPELYDFDSLGGGGR